MHYPSKSTISLPPLSKGGGLTARHKLLLCCVLLAIPCLFLFAKLFCRQDGGIAFLPHPFRFSDASANNPSIVGSASHCNRSSPLHKGAKGDSALPTLPKPHYPLPRTTFLPPLSKVRCCRPKKFGRLPEGLLHPTSPSLIRTFRTK